MLLAVSLQESFSTFSTNTKYLRGENKKIKLFLRGDKRARL